MRKVFSPAHVYVCAEGSSVEIALGRDLILPSGYVANFFGDGVRMHPIRGPWSGGLVVHVSKVIAVGDLLGELVISKIVEEC